MRSIVVAAATLALCATALPASATAATTVYGYAWADGKGALRVLPMKATLVEQYGVPRYRLAPVAGAKERRVTYSGSEFRRITAACDLKETEGVVRLDKKGLGRTRCGAKDLAFALGLGPVAVRISAGRIHEFLATPSDPRTAFGTIKRINDSTVVFTKGSTSVKLGYTALPFHRATRKCGDGWLANHTSAGRDGLGTKHCDTPSFTKVMKSVRHPVLAKVDYNPVSGHLLEVWEVFGDA